MRARAGFTLIELLVVMAIITILAGLVVVSVGKIRQRALEAEAVSNIASLKTALEAYHASTTIYPNAGLATPKDDPEALFKALYTGNPRLGGDRESHLSDWKMERIGLWPGRFLTGEGEEYQTPSREQLDFQSGNYTPCVLLDPWGRPYHYVEWDSHPPSRRQIEGGQLRAVGGQKYAIWSNGPNRRNDWGEEDDITSWK
ncbi:MAG: hypothetical protein KatS3mg102_2881 [Planctomycetota bacterium]|nr:MAG: hypothetical protein KatS3mg102_2881 [Planctomycetota bacterium]